MSLTALAEFLSLYGLAIGVIALCLLLVALFNGAETALTLAARRRAQDGDRGGDHSPLLVERLVARRDRVIGALVIGSRLAGIVAVAVGASLFVETYGPAAIWPAIGLLACLLVVFCDVLPRALAIAAPERFAGGISRPLQPLVFLLEPVSSAVNGLVRGLLALFGHAPPAEAPILSAHEELRSAVAQLHREGGVVKADRDRLGGVLDLDALEVSDIMVHRLTMRMVNADDPPGVIVRQILDSPFTRMPVWRGTADNIIGVIHAKDLLRALADPAIDAENIDITRITQKPGFVPDTTGLKDQLSAFLRRRTHFALVVDEYGELRGLVTLEDILEEIVGDIADEHDIAIQGVRQEADGSIVVDGSVPIRDLNRALDWNLPDEEATTIAGLVIHESRIIPQERQAFTFYGKRFIVMKRVKNRITRLRIRPVQAEGPGAEDVSPARGENAASQDAVVKTQGISAR
ncbi:hypothetical protein BJF93_01265 [Xaviernesmea oryzae]|uniref:HlyC/CorC family transporter n=1 Tax=Xaviernesmea oryzae TaxID=464029 RepID=A0A1Q9B267_9HYPH|nr:HlyC/CorC family transporter [Xaviernesmea oryzae]OLP62109.1 hypothetical protein BJF93_01265 [Xaviernesmea oryzae]SEL87732.1 Mg2+ and Co2+ transporter CorB, contains DUF21, CBS pair, and CorC-HlyC domains [Xaviernesmea oryzae]